jgi:ribonucleotide reductase beta subunit family protein with ferritin-like domain
MEDRINLSTDKIPFMVLNLKELYEIIDFIIKEMQIKESFQTDNAQTIFKIKLGEEYPLFFSSFVEFKSYIWTSLLDREIKYFEVSVSAIDVTGEAYSVGLFLNHSYSLLIASSLDKEKISKIFSNVQIYLKRKARKLSWVMKHYVMFLSISGILTLMVSIQVSPLYGILCYLIIVSVTYLKMRYVRFNRIILNLNIAET